MSQSIVFTFIGLDKPGLVEKLSNTVSTAGGNWLESRMSQLAGHFTGIARVQISSDKSEALISALQALSGDELTVSIQPDHHADKGTDYKIQKLHLLGNDRPGIVKELSSALAAFNINVCDMETQVTSAPMTAEPLFEANAEIEVPSHINMAELSDKLEDIANTLTVDINLED